MVTAAGPRNIQPSGFPGLRQATAKAPIASGTSTHTGTELLAVFRL
jgi:hypothetical protein